MTNSARGRKPVVRGPTGWVDLMVWLRDAEFLVAQLRKEVLAALSKVRRPTDPADMAVWLGDAESIVTRFSERATAALMKATENVRPPAKGRGRSRARGAKKGRK